MNAWIVGAVVMASVGLVAGAETEPVGSSLSLDLGGGITLETVLVPSGTFQMGRPDYSEVLASDFPVLARDFKENADVDLIDPLWDLDPTKTVALLAEKLVDGEEQENKFIIQELSRLEVDIRPLLPTLLQVLRSGKDPWYRATAVAAIRLMGETAANAVPELVIALTDKEECVRRYAASALGAIGPKSSEAIPMLERLQADSSSPPKANKARTVAREAQTAIEKIKAGSASPPNWHSADSLAEVSGQGKELVLTLATNAQIDHIVLMEDPGQKNRVREYVVESQVDGRWKELAHGGKIGRKKIHRFSPEANPYQGIQVRSDTEQVYIQGVPTAAKAFRLRAIDSDGDPIIRKFAVYNTGRAWARELRRPSEWTPIFSEYPQHKVTISKAFYLGKYEVTNEQYERVMGYNSSVCRDPKNPADGGGPQKLADMKRGGRDTGQFKTGSLGWNDAQTFCRKVGELTGRTVRLPTEAEWEYAARAGGPPHVCNTAFLNRVAWWGDNSDGKTHPVGQKEPNAWGLHDMHGNVSEWTLDWVSEYTADAVVDPHGPDNPSSDAPRKVVRGGVRHCISNLTTKFGKPVEFSRCDIGFRVVVESRNTRSPAWNNLK